MSAAMFLERGWGRIRRAIFYALNRSRFKRLDFKAFINKPLRIDGRRYISLLSGANIGAYVWLGALKLDEHEPELIIGEGCSIGAFNHIVAIRRVVLGQNVLTANGVYISDNLHGFEDIHTPVLLQPVQFKAEVHIGDGAWLGENVCVIGASVGRNCVIGANAVVTKDIPDYCVAIGAPARVIKRFNFETEQWESIDSASA
jgi:acetyltransferase-like isoleucine patch superfamily enzyme